MQENSGSLQIFPKMSWKSLRKKLKMTLEKFFKGKMHQNFRILHATAKEKFDKKLSRNSKNDRREKSLTLAKDCGNK